MRALTTEARGRRWGAVPDVPAAPIRRGGDPRRRLLRSVGNRAVAHLASATSDASTSAARTDPLEREAEDVAREVTNAPSAARSAAGVDRSSPGHASSADSGRQLSGPLRELMERRLGADLRPVRVHTGAQATAAARTLRARAFTRGTDVWLGAHESEHDLGLMAHELTHVVQQTDPQRNRVLSGSGGGASGPVQLLPLGITLPTGLRGLDPVEERIGRRVFASSLDYGDIYVTDGLGGGGRPFTLYLPGVGTVLQMGSGPYTTPGSNPSLLIHELTHSWQSQHHPNPAQYMANSLESQALASAAGGGASPYCYLPGKSFGSYGAEQIAQQVERGEPPIRAHVSSVAAGSWDLSNVLSLSIPRWETRGAPGVRC